MFEGCLETDSAYGTGGAPSIRRSILDMSDGPDGLVTVLERSRCALNDGADVTLLDWELGGATHTSPRPPLELDGFVTVLARDRPEGGAKLSVRGLEPKESCIAGSTDFPNPPKADFGPPEVVGRLLSL